MHLSIVAAISKNGVIRHNGSMPWPHNKVDLNRFRTLTMGRSVILGRKTYQSLPTPLKGRRKIVLSRSLYCKGDGVVTVTSVTDAINAVCKQPEAMVIGGGEIYEQFLPYCHTMYLTTFLKEYDGNVKFPSIDFNQWKIIAEEHFSDHYFDVLKRCVTI